MRQFELIDGERKGTKPCAVITCDQARGTFGAKIAEWAGPNDVPVQFSPTVEHGKRKVPARWVNEWVEERIAPPSRQNIGEILRAHGLDHYDSLELLLSNEGRSTQDGFYLREITPGYQKSAQLGEQISRARSATRMTQEELAAKSGVRQETISRIERGNASPSLRTLEALASALGKRLEVRLV